MEYLYNVRSWLTGLGSPLISMSMGYENSEGGSPSCYSGNQFFFQWRINSSGEGISHRYNYSYDGLSRLVSALYTGDLDLHPANYDTFYNYDRNGNILSLRRNGKYVGDVCGIIDDLFYEYDGNRLVKVSNAVESPCYKGAMHFSDGADEETEYLYDDDGNMVCDKNRGISEITYNIILKPEHIRFNTGRYMSLVYSATGEKLQANYMLELPRLHEPGIRTLSSGQSGFGNSLGGLDGPVGPGIRDSLIDKDRPQLGDNQYALIYGAHRTDYCGNVIYEDLCLKPDRILFDGGYVTFSNKQPVYHFYLTDHQGNVRVVASADGTLEETNHYYPFGALFGESAGSSRQRYKYNGKELERLLSLDWYDYGARWYDPVLARWHAVDPLAEKYPDVSPYVYCLNNPVNKIDPDGRKIVDANGRQMLYYDSEGKIYFTKYANIDARILVNCLKLTRTGTAMLEQLIKSDIKVHFQISDKTVMTNKSITYGTTLQGNMNKKDNYGKTDDGKGIKESTITVYRGAIKESIKEGSGLKHEGLTEEQAIGAVVGHEAVHGTNKKEISTDLQYELKGKNNPYREILPNIIERNIIYEYKNEKLYE